MKHHINDMKRRALHNADAAYYTAPYLWGVTGLAYDSAQVEGGVLEASWKEYFEPRPELEGKIAALDTASDVILAASLYLGIPQCTESNDDAKRILELLEAQKPKLKLYSSDSTVDRLASGEVALHQVWNGATARATAQRDTIRFLYPAEGTPMSGRRAARLRDYIENERRVLSACTTPPEVRAGRLLEQMLRFGTTAVRSHIDVAPDIGLAHVEAMLRLREAWSDRVDLQFVAFPQQGLLSRPGTADLMREAIAMGVETVGGLDPAGIDGDPEGQLRFVFDLATQTGAGVDIHLHDKAELGAWQVERIADHTQAAGLTGKVMISHAYCLGQIPMARLERIGRRLADLGISLMTSAPADVAVPPVEELTAMGVTVCCGSDGIRDAWSPLGNGDLLERAFLTAFRFDWNTDEDFRRALDCATTQAARAIGLADYGLHPGARADFVMIDAITAGDALCRRPSARRVVRRGFVVAG